MKKRVLLVVTLILLILISGCNKESSQTSDLTAEELAEVGLPTEKAIAGQAVKWTNCVDSDSKITYDKSSLPVVGTTSYSGGSFTDQCYTWYKGTSQEKTRLLEGTCSNGKFIYWYADCNVLGADYKCVNGISSGGMGGQGQKGSCVKVPGVESCLSKTGLNGLTILSNGESCSYEVNGKKYIITLEKITYEKLPNIDTAPQPIALFKIKTPFQTIIQNISPMKVLRIENTLTILTPPLYVEPPTEYRFKIRNQIKINDLEFTFVRNCTDAFSEVELINKCNTFVSNYKNLIFPTMEKLFGLNIGECFDNVIINIEENSMIAGANPGEYSLYISIGENLIKDINASQWGNYEVHEALHALNFCANIPSEEDGLHFYWFLREGEIYRELGNEQIADEKFNNAITMYQKVQADKNMLENKEAMWGGCHGIKTHLLTEYYVQTNKTLVEEFYKRILIDPYLLNDLTDNYAFNKDVAEVLGNNPEEIALINKYCFDNI